MPGTMSWGSEALGPGPFPLTSLGKSHATPLAVDVLTGVSIAGEAARTLDPGQNGNVRSLGKRPHLLEPLPPSKLRTEQWADRPIPSRGRTYALAFFPSTPWTDANGCFPPVGRRLGISHSVCSVARSVHLIDRCRARNKSCGVVRVVSRSPYSGQLLPAWGKSVKSCGFGAGWKVPGLIKAFPARSTRQRHNDQVR
jgi:hypothetical protein